MAIDLGKPANEVDINSAEYRTMLGNLQANILKAHGRNFARHIFLRFTATPAAVKTWIRTVVAPKVTTAAQHFEQISRRRATPGFDGGMVTGFFLSAAGYRLRPLHDRQVSDSMSEMALG
jgi:deferrochelatase/peroxidase EfeB